ncbi:MAG: class I SAM-dependent methyltransferase [Planctomycetota bacterium]
MPQPFAIAVTDARLKPAAEQLAADLHAPLHSSRHPADARFLLRLTPDHLELALGPTPPPDTPPGLTPLIPTLTPRTTPLSDPLAKALGLRRGNPHRPAILDATAGLLADAATIAALGCPTTALERHPAVHALAADALRRAAAPATLTLHPGDAQQQLADHPPPEVIHLDPMFPPRRKGRPQKAMWMLHALLGDTDAHDAPALLRNALQHATRRVIVKRPRLAPPLNETHADLPPPTAQHTGKSHRYDIYPTG